MYPYLLISKIKEPELPACLPACATQPKQAQRGFQIKICATEIFMNTFIYEQSSRDGEAERMGGGNAGCHTVRQLLPSSWPGQRNEQQQLLPLSQFGANQMHKQSECARGQKHTKK